jgi:hypothetical protein
VLVSLERYWFKDPLIENLREQLGLATVQQHLDGLTVLVLPSIDGVAALKVFKTLSYGPFHSIVVIDETMVTRYSGQPCQHMA